MQASDEQPLDDRERFFPACRDGRVFLNHSGIAPITGPAAEALRRYADEAVISGPPAYRSWWSGLMDTRDRVARLVGGRSSEVAFLPNTTFGIATVANGLDWASGDRVVGFEGDYPANVYPWRQLESRGVTHELLPAPRGIPDLDVLESALERGDVRVVAVSSVCFWSGARAPLARISELAHAHGALVFVDGIQSLGALAMDVNALGIDFLASGGHKWLMSGQGVGFLWVRGEHLEKLAVLAFGADSVDPVLPFLDYHGKLAPSARRHESGTLPAGNILALGATLELFERIGADTMEERILANGRILIEGLREAGYEVVTPPWPNHRSGIVAATHPELSPAEIVQALTKRDIVAIEREGLLRMAPHAYQSEEDMRRVVEALPR